MCEKLNTCNTWKKSLLPRFKLRLLSILNNWNNHNYNYNENNNNIDNNNDDNIIYNQSTPNQEIPDKHIIERQLNGLWGDEKLQEQ